MCVCLKNRIMKHLEKEKKNQQCEVTNLIPINKSNQQTCMILWMNGYITQT